ncbi:unnamed protein product [Coffea canephora]|uniref:Pectate lyase n=1 Tax=Coffea canephora TaxID=49390 RepID=A0A068UK23_COFCA|nr:unnamed protein product [Coffea canephora]
MNAIDSCWRSDPNWDANRQALADCARGFGADATGGKNGRVYTVTDSSDNPSNPKPGTLRYGAIQREHLWIIFAEDMIISLKTVLSVSSYKTIDGRGVKVEIANGPCMEVRSASHVITHGISIHDCEAQRPGLGDAITITGSSDVWIDHCFFSSCVDGLVDIILLAKSYMHVMLLGHDDDHDEDKSMRITVAFNYFGPGLVQRMPRVRHGYAHVANNRYERWTIYAIGGSANPTILSEGNQYTASDNPRAKEVTMRIQDEDWKTWTRKSSRDVFNSGAFFVQSGSGSYLPNYSPSQSFTVAHGAAVLTLTSDAGPLECNTNKTC